MKKRSTGVILVLLALLGMFALIFAGCKTKPKDQPELPDSGNEAGLYYFAPESGDEYLFTMGGKSTYTLVMDGKTEIGTYTLDGATLTLKQGEGTKNATFGGNELTIDINGAQVRFLKKVNFTVSFNSNGGSAVETKTVVNGKTLSAVSVPTREGYVFLGWYSDEALKTPFLFDATPVMADCTLFARWAEKPTDVLEFKIHYDLGYDGETIPDAETIGGKLYNAAKPAERAGYQFIGWWISDRNLGGKLTFRLVEGGEAEATVFTADTTLFAVWQSKASKPTLTVSVTEKAVVWDAFEGANGYLIKVTSPDGSVLVDNRTTSTTFPLSLEMAGEYTVEVTAVKGDTALTEATVRVFTNKALNRVTGFTVSDSFVLMFRGVEHAEKYYITVECGNPKHQHKAFDNGSALYYNFANCDMKEGGIVFTVTATAKGYASSETTFVYERKLDKVNGITVADGRLTWNQVSGATSYVIRTADKIYTVLGNNLDLSALESGTYSITVTPVAHGANSVASDVFTYEKKSPALPADLTLIGTLLKWNAVSDATSYEVKLNGKSLTVAKDATEVDLAGVMSFSEGIDYTITFKAINASGSAEKTMVVRYNAMNPTLSYESGVLRWMPVLGATSYDVQIGNGEIVSIENGNAFYEIASFAKAGENTLSVRFHNGVFTSEWVTITVTTYKVTLDSRGGSSVDSIYKAVGDPMVLPKLTKSGYTFDAWYNLPGGAESNGRLYADSYFVESGEVVLYAYYTPKAYTIRCDYGDDTDGTETVYYGKHYQLTVPKSTNGTRAFGGWYSAPYGAGIAFTDAEGNSLAPWNFVDENVTVYAFWVDAVLRYEKVGNAYMVAKGARIDLVTSITVPATYKGLPVTEIISGAFENCTTLTEIRLPDTLTRIATDSAFQGCENLTSVEVYESGEVKYSRYSSADGVLFDNGASGAEHAMQPVFMPAAKTGTYTVPGGVTSIPRSAFANSKLSKIIIPVSVTEIGTEAFANCPNLVSVVFTDAGATVGVKPLTIGDRAFLNCTGLNVIALPARLHSISLCGYTTLSGQMEFTNTPNAFEGCTNLTDVIVSKGANTEFVSVDGVLFGEKGTSLVYFPTAKSAENYEIPAGVTKIGDSAFLGAGLKGELRLPGRVISVGQAAFANCSRLTAVIFSDGISNVEIGDYAFYATGISQITFEKGSRVTKIGARAFKKGDNYSGMLADKILIIPSTVTEVGDEAFAGFGKLDVTIEPGSSTLKFGNHVFYDCIVGTLKIPANVTAVANFFSGMSVSEIEVDENNAFFASRGGVLYSKNAAGKLASLLLYPSGKTDASFTVEDGVTAIADGAFKGNTWLEEIIFPSSLTSIGKEAFCQSTKLASVTFNQTEGKLAIGDYAFYQLNLKALNLPANAEITIGDYAFADNKMLESVSLGKTVSIGNHAFEKMAQDADSDVELVLPETLKTIGHYAFNGAKVATASFPGTSALETIGAYAFSETSLSSFTVPASVRVIYAYAFSENDSLQSLLFEEGTADLVLGAPYNTGYSVEYGNVIYSAYSLKELHLPARLTVIEREAFRYASDLKTVTFGSEGAPSRLTTIGEKAFYSTGLTTVTIPASVRNTADSIAIGTEAFAFSSLTDIIFEMGGSSDTAPLTIGKDAFNGNTSLTAVVLPARFTSFTDADGNTIAPLGGSKLVFGSSIESIEISGNGKSEYTSYDGCVFNADKTELIFCPRKKSGTVTIPASVKKIAAMAFDHCENLTSIEFASGSVCEEIGEQAFSFCNSIKEIVLPDTVVSIEQNAFMSSRSLESFTIPAGLEYFNSLILNNCEALQSLNASPNNANYMSKDGVLFSKDGKTLVYYLPTRTDTEYKVPDGTEEILASAFNSNKNLTSVTLPASMKCVGKSAFFRCTNLQSVTFAEGGTEPLVISAQSFSRTALTSIHIPARTAAIGESAFSASALANITFDNESKLSYIGDAAFESTQLTSVVSLPSSLRTMGNRVFASCYNLVNVTLPEGLQSVGTEFFKDSSSLEMVNLPATLQTLGNFAFENCYSLQNVNFAKNSVIKVLYVGTFYGCTSLSSIELPASLTEIPDKGLDASGDQYEGLFTDCTSLSRVAFEEGSKLTKIGSFAFKNTALTSISFPSSVAEIGQYAFEKTKLTTLYIPSTLTLLGTGAFFECEDLVTVSIASGIKALPDGVFAYCAQLSDFTVPASVNSIDSSALRGCESIVSFTVDPANTSFRVQDGVVYDMDWNLVLFPYGKTSFTIPAGTKNLPDKFFEDYMIESIEIEEGNTAFQLIGGALYDTDMTTLFFLSQGLTEFVIPERIPSAMDPSTFFQIIADYGFESVTLSAENKDCKLLYGVIYYEYEDMGLIPMYIPKDLTEFVIPKDVTYLYCPISNYIFSGSDLQTVRFEEGRTQELTIGSYFFYNAKKLTSVTLPAETVSIGNRAFYGCTSITEFVLPAAVTYVGNMVFYNWTADQTIYVYFDADSVPDSFDYRWNRSCKANIVYGYTGE